MLAKVRNWLFQQRRVLTAAVGVAAGVSLLRLSGMLQPWEWAAWDQMFRWRQAANTDDRILIVGIGEEEIQQGNWPVGDRVMAELLRKIDAHNPRAIGLDVYRSRPRPPGHEELLQAFADIPNLVGIEKIGNSSEETVTPPEFLDERDRVGFNNVVFDRDGKIRRSLFYWHMKGESHTSFALKLALMYLRTEGITPKGSHPEGYLQLGDRVFPRFQSRDGGYVNADDGGYQVLVNFRGPAGMFPTVSMNDVLQGKVPSEKFRDRIVLIGSVAPSLKDLFQTPYSESLLNSPQRIPGVELHANFISQIISAVLDDRPIIKVWPNSVEYLWIVLWSSIGAGLAWRLRSPAWSLVGVLVSGGVLLATCYFLFLPGWWIPLIPPALALTVSAVAITGYIAHLEEELKQSKEFLHSVIDTIPDPIYVKNKQHRWVVLNEAYSEFLGYPTAALIDRSEYDFFAPADADRLHQEDELVFQSGEDRENEEKFTDATGSTRFIATKRSLHRDAAGNVFLVGVIRDITERKQMEEELKRTAAELTRSNEELQRSQSRLRHQAYHDDLTGLPNRVLFHERLDQAIQWADTSEEIVALLYIDLDGFKEVNDNQGHAVGNLLLQAVAKRLVRCLRSSDTVARLGGDEFTAILPGIREAANAERVAQKIQATISEPFELEGHKIQVTPSIGISIYPLHSRDRETLIDQADDSMYAAKKQGKNCYKLAQPSAG
jgi:diguanylate cyclase (GGDEF)-like protein/PAS domain S-box-containing protein